MAGLTTGHYFACEMRVIRNTALILLNYFFEGGGFNEKGAIIRPFVFHSFAP